MKIRERVEAVKAIPDQMRKMAILAVSSIVIAIIAMLTAMVGVTRNAH